MPTIGEPTGGWSRRAGDDVAMTVDALMKRPSAEIQNYGLEVLPLLQMWGDYKRGFRRALSPGVNRGQTRVFAMGSATH